MKNRLSKIIFLISVLTLNASAGPGDLDPSFGPPRTFGGVRTFQMNHLFRPCCIAQQADGKLLVAGTMGEDEPQYLILRRHLVTTGGLDSSFGLGGEATWNNSEPVFSVYGRVYGIAVQPDGRTLVSGTSSGGTAAIWRFTTAGQIDTTFGNAGIQLVGSSGQSGAGAIAVSDGKIYVVLYQGGSSRILRRFLSGGADTTFGFFGSVALPAGINARVLAVDPVSGSVYVGAGTSTDGYVYRFLAGGSLDTGFGNTGQVYVPNSQCNFAGLTAIHDLGVQSDNKLIVAGSSYYPNMVTVFAPFVFRLTTAGESDTTFGGPGPICLQQQEYSTTPPWNSSRVALQDDGKLISLAFDSAYPALKRINNDGSTDATFDPSYSSGGYAFDVLVQSGDGKLVVLATPPGVDAEAYRLIRYLP